MGTPIVRLDDPSDHGGKMVTASGILTVRGKPVCLDGDMHECGNPLHGTTPVTATSKIISNGKRIVRVGDKAQCGATITEGSFNIDSN